jgi:hypothetical protein
MIGSNSLTATLRSSRLSDSGFTQSTSKSVSQTGSILKTSTTGTTGRFPSTSTKSASKFPTSLSSLVHTTKIGGDSSKISTEAETKSASNVQTSQRKTATSSTQQGSLPSSLTKSSRSQEKPPTSVGLSSVFVSSSAATHAITLSSSRNGMSTQTRASTTSSVIKPSLVLPTIPNFSLPTGNANLAQEVSAIEQEIRALLSWLQSLLRH